MIFFFTLMVFTLEWYEQCLLQTVFKKLCYKLKLLVCSNKFCFIYQELALASEHLVGLEKYKKEIEIKMKDHQYMEQQKTDLERHVQSLIKVTVNRKHVRREMKPGAVLICPSWVTLCPCKWVYVVGWLNKGGGKLSLCDLHDSWVFRISGDTVSISCCFHSITDQWMTAWAENCPFLLGSIWVSHHTCNKICCPPISAILLCNFTDIVGIQKLVIEKQKTGGFVLT